MLRRTAGDGRYGQPVQALETMDNLIAGTTAEPLFQARLLTAFAILALVLTAIGAVTPQPGRQEVQPVGPVAGAKRVHSHSVTA